MENDFISMNLTWAAAVIRQSQASYRHLCCDHHIVKAFQFDMAQSAARRWSTRAGRRADIEEIDRDPRPLRRPELLSKRA